MILEALGTIGFIYICVGLSALFIKWIDKKTQKTERGIRK